MFRDTMLHNNNINQRLLYNGTKILGMTEKDINTILNEKTNTTEHIFISAGPWDNGYLSSYYGSISIKDF